MGQIAYRANLSAATFPMTIADGGRTVIVPGPDQNFDRRVDPEGSQRDAGIPQALYLENVMPTPYGYQSVGYLSPTVPMTLGVGQYIYSCHEIYTTDGLTVGRVPLFQSSTGVFTCGFRGTGTITFVGIPPAGNAVLTSAAVAGISYLYDLASSRLYTVTGGTNLTITEITSTVLPVNFTSTAGVRYILSFANYLIAVTANRVYWSSLTTPTDFTASLVSGAGSIIPNDLVGNIIEVQVCSDGFYLLTTSNGIFVQYTGNARYPFKFTVVRGFNGIKDYYRQFQVSWGSISYPSILTIDSANQVQLINKIDAAPVATELDQFLEKDTIQELLNYSTNVLIPTVEYTAVPSIYLFHSRYVVVSINDKEASYTTQYTHALVIDLKLRRTGKLKITHKFLFSCFLLANASDPSKEAFLAFVNTTAGLIKYLSFDMYNQSDIVDVTYDAMVGALILGKFQYVRSRLMKMEEIEIEGPQNTAIIPSPNFSCVLLPSQAGRNFDAPIPLSPTSISGGLVEYHCHNTAKNHSLLLKGAFSVNTVQLKFVPAGDR